jgi:hypothetical protein
MPARLGAGQSFCLVQLEAPSRSSRRTNREHHHQAAARTRRREPPQPPPRHCHSQQAPSRDLTEAAHRANTLHHGGRCLRMLAPLPRLGGLHRRPVACAASPLPHGGCNAAARRGPPEKLSPPCAGQQHTVIAATHLVMCFRRRDH